MPPSPIQTGLLLVGHGTRSRQGEGEFLEVAEQVARRLTGVCVEPACLELTEPTILQGVWRLVERGARQIVVVPLLLFAAGHAKRDIPAAAEAAARELNVARLTLHYASHLGCDARVVQLSRQRFTESLQGRPEVSADRTFLLLVGRGSHDDSASAEMHHFAQLRAENSPVGGVAVAFIAMAPPAVQDVLSQLAEQDWQRIVVQPHLLFHGELLDQLQRLVAAAGVRNPRQEWILAPHLAQGIAAGSSVGEQLVGAILHRFGQAREAAIRVVGPERDG